MTATATSNTTTSPQIDHAKFKEIDTEQFFDSFLCDYSENYDCGYQEGDYPQWQVSIGQVPREVEELVQFETVDKKGKEYEDLGYLDIQRETSTEDHGEDGGNSAEILLITDPIPADAYDFLPMEQPYRFMLSGSAGWPSYCDDESDGHFNGTMALIPDDQELIEKLEKEHNDRIAREIHGHFAVKAREMLSLRTEDILLCRAEIDILNRAYAKALSEKAKNAAETESNAPESQVAMTTKPFTNDQDDNVPALAGIVTEIVRLDAVGHGDTAYLHMEGDYHDLCQDIAHNVKACLCDTGFVSGVWCVGGVPDAREVVIVINEELDDQKDGALSINDQGGIVWRPRHQIAHNFQSETDQIIAASDPWHLIEELMGVEPCEKWRTLAQHLSIQPKIAKVSERMVISEIIFEPQD